MIAPIRSAAASLAVAVAALAVPAFALTTGAVAAPRAGMMVRENFDRLPLGPVTGGRGWSTDVSGGSMTIEPSAAGRGRDLHVHTVGNGRAFMVLTGPTPPGDGFWARLRLRVSAFPSAPDWAHWTIAEASGSGSPTLVRPLGGQYVPSAAGDFWGVGSDLGPTGDWTAWRTSEPAVAGVWQCAEFHLDAAGDRVTVYLDGVERPDLTVSRKVHGGTADDFVFPRFHTLKLGWQLYQADPVPSSYDLRLDDVAVSRHRVGCAR